MKQLAPLLARLVSALEENLEVRTPKDEMLKVSILRDGKLKTWETVETIAPKYPDGWREQLPSWHEARGAIRVCEEGTAGTKKPKELGRTVWHNPGYTLYKLTEGEYHNLGFFDTFMDALEAL